MVNDLCGLSPLSSLLRPAIVCVQKREDMLSSNCCLLSDERFLSRNVNIANLHLTLRNLPLNSCLQICVAEGGDRFKIVSSFGFIIENKIHLDANSEGNKTEAKKTEGFGLYHKPQITCNPPKAFSFDGCFCINKWNSAKLLLCVLLGISNIVPINSSSLLSVLTVF
ncbi:hypothetical protein Y1Q_0017543 [Alligator mississippiensis]|uniref:Uncharacterized protein n=1 Tax=Alligator mississippiensis TaxID=8496 RepID=A0A151P3A5_ALLMI|nr:hypothetical protein Y1Q_0017543 [Alligator mississippiensis]